MKYACDILIYLHIHYRHRCGYTIQLSSIYLSIGLSIYLPINLYMHTHTGRSMDDATDLVTCVHTD